MVQKSELKKLAKEHGTPLFVVDHDELRSNYAEFRKRLPRVQAYYAVKANPDPAIVRTLYREGGSFDVASMPEFEIVHENIKDLSAKQRQDFIWDKIIYAKPDQGQRGAPRVGPVQAAGDLRQLRRDPQDSQARPPRRPWPCGSGCPTRGPWSELSSKFGAASGEAVGLIEAAHEAGLVVEGLSFHVGSQTTNFENYVQALNLFRPASFARRPIAVSS